MFATRDFRRSIVQPYVKLMNVQESWNGADMLIFKLCSVVVDRQTSRYKLKEPEKRTRHVTRDERDVSALHDEEKGCKML